MVRNSPQIRDVIPDLVAFIGDAPIVGHNIKFDLSFLQKFTNFSRNERIDTFELASVLLPSASRYNLGALGKQLGILLPATHRALDDARVTASVFHILSTKAEDLPIELIAEICRFCKDLDWDGAWAFQEIYRIKLANQEHKRIKKYEINYLSVLAKNKPGDQSIHPLSIPDEPIPVDIDLVSSMLDYGSPFSQNIT